ncbi:hypothetical protein GDO86_011978 [Hymenochirus boettgeri]|uniref:P2X purinoreceptor 7 intracellular domain-containing protein n=1 Tax=Hymenochirus boettgeri TaxID=247094 RepID=A0A8T2JIN2_9PIPI|nr:hypothetical protein GDO86_011978 [Hymenochirus boettgeri]KAG8443387.1 hypothetical protein GDO86_011978 [Hymenochirus boettgeri]
MEPRFPGSVQIKIEEEEVHIDQLNQVKSLSVPLTDRDTSPDVLKIKVKEEESALDSEYSVNPMPCAEGQLTAGAFVLKTENEQPGAGHHLQFIKREIDSDPQIEIKQESQLEYNLNPEEYVAVQYSEEGFHEARTKTLQIMKEESDCEDHENPLEFVEVTVGNVGVMSGKGRHSRGHNADQSSDPEMKELLERLMNRPEVRNAYECFPCNPQKKKRRMRNLGEDGQESDGSEGSSTDYNVEGTDRLGNVDWCQCARCAPMKSQIECTCCTEIRQIKELIPEDASCITEHPIFITECTIHSTIDRAFRMINIDLKKKPKKTEYMRGLRKTAFRSFMVWIYGYLGDHHCKPIPTCVVSKVREAFPAPRGYYNGYLGPHDYLAEAMALD